MSLSDRMEGDLIEKPSAHPAERTYQKHLPRVEHLPESHQRKWLYYKLFPNVAFRSDGRRPDRKAVGSPGRADLPKTPAARGALAGEPPAQVAVLQAVPQCRFQIGWKAT